MDKKLFKKINNYADKYHFLDIFFIFISKKVRYLYVIILIFLWFKNNLGRRSVYDSVFSVSIALIFNFFYKKITYKPRPFVKYNVNYLIRSKRNSTFPSKHTLLTFVVSTSILINQRILGIMLVILSTITGFSRIWVGSHYPSDIIKSSFLGCFISVVTNRLWMQIKKATLRGH